MLKKIVLGALALLALAAAYLRPAYSVSLGGRALSGRWSPSELLEARRFADDAAAELGGGPAPEPEARLGLSFGSAEGGADSLAFALLEAAPGVQKAWRIKVDGVDIGRAGDLSALEEALLAYIAESAPAESVAAAVTSDLESEAVFIPAGSADSTMELSALLRSLTRVGYVTSDGGRFYA